MSALATPIDERAGAAEAGGAGQVARESDVRPEQRPWEIARQTVSDRRDVWGQTGVRHVSDPRLTLV